MENINGIKLYTIEVLKCGIKRLQSQLLLGSDSADFILENGILKHWDRGNRGFDFYDYNKPYKIIR